MKNLKWTDTLYLPLSEKKLEVLILTEKRNDWDAVRW